MSHIEVILIIALVLGIIISNLMVLKHTAKMKWPTKAELTDPVAKLKKQSESSPNQAQSTPDNDK